VPSWLVTVTQNLAAGLWRSRVPGSLVNGITGRLPFARLRYYLAALPRDGALEQVL
jgi:hypothetical protein